MFDWSWSPVLAAMVSNGDCYSDEWSTGRLQRSGLDLISIRCMGGYPRNQIRVLIRKYERLFWPAIR